MKCCHESSIKFFNFFFSSHFSYQSSFSEVFLKRFFIDDIRKHTLDCMLVKFVFIFFEIFLLFLLLECLQYFFLISDAHRISFCCFCCFTCIAVIVARINRTRKIEEVYLDNKLCGFFMDHCTYRSCLAWYTRKCN
ncbi:unnamed protein product [Moneuplotes crassus]|uniref:Uncharacterized protein n=1 Tax=Euplotes crassus TaxID=5936 RepID=A0AAD2D6M5_EUPCR|nr:unnamed protein product [Moneuplotes crassus]